jgi:AcrR family transcriptional regulator
MTDAGGSRPYHHGDLRRALVEAAVERVARDGPASLSLRELSRAVGVSHAAPRHHFGDRAGLFTAVAIEGFRDLDRELEAAWQATASLLELGVAYVRFAAAHPGHFAVMFRPDLLHADDAELAMARDSTWQRLLDGVEGMPGVGTDREAAATAAWSLTHGLATLWLGGNLPVGAADPGALTRSIARYLFAPLPTTGPEASAAPTGRTRSRRPG